MKIRIEKGQHCHLWILDSHGYAFKSLQIMDSIALLKTIKRYQAAPDCVNIEVYAQEKASGQNERIMIWHKGRHNPILHRLRKRNSMLNNECKNVHQLLDLALVSMRKTADGPHFFRCWTRTIQRKTLVWWNEAHELFSSATQMSIHTTKPNKEPIEKTNLAFAFNNDGDHQRGKELIHIPLAALKEITGINWMSVNDNDHFEIWLKPEDQPHWIERKYERQPQH